jgi:hypothetical protein
VLISLEKEHGKKLEKLAEQRPRGTQIYLHHALDVAVRVALPLPDRTPSRICSPATSTPPGFWLAHRFKPCLRSCPPLSRFQRTTILSFKF